MNNNYDYQRHGFLNAWEAVSLIKVTTSRCSSVR